MLHSWTRFGMFTLVILVLYIISTCASSDSRLLHRSKRYIEWGPDIAGPYCETRPQGCCPGRIDTCSVPILDTLCYCDEFCNRTRGDCCPDFFSFCRGQDRRTTPAPIRECVYIVRGDRICGNRVEPLDVNKPKSQLDKFLTERACDNNGRPYGPNAAIKINCKQCRCSPDSRSKTGYSWRCDDNICLIRENIINIVNTRNLGWKASNYSKFWGMSLEEGRRYRLGTYKPDSLVLNMNPIKVPHNGRLPESFDARTKWPGWVHGIRDQGNCAASWAFSTTALAADRLTIESRGAAPDFLSPQNLMSCNNHGQNGCKGGYLDRAWWFIRKRGVTTEDCYPYVSGDTDSVGRCQVARGQTGGTCPSGIPFRIQRVFHSTPPYRISMSERDIMSEIEMNGPVQATFKVKEDFFMYKSGVYSYSRAVPETTSNSEEKYSYHSVRILGWGLDRSSAGNLKYWICANSWGNDWGENGYFRIERGSNECEIESFVLGTWGKVQGDQELRALLQGFRQERQRQRFRENRRRSRRHLRRRHKRVHRKQ